MSRSRRGKVDASKNECLVSVLTNEYRAPVAESVDALDLKSNWAYNPVPVQVWPGAYFKTPLIGEFFSLRVIFVCNIILTN